MRKQRLFKTVRGEVRSAAEVFNLMGALEQRAALFAAMDDTSHEYWIDLPAARPYVRDLQLFGVRQHMPLIFAAWECMPPDDFVRVLKLLCALAFRYTVIGGRNTNELEPAYHRAAKGLLDGQIVTPAAVFQSLRDIYVGDEHFVREFATKEIETHGRRKKLAKYVLCQLEGDVSGRLPDWETDAGTIEHVLPENPTSVWDESFQPERQKDFIYRIGNLLLLESSINREAQNAPFAEKLALYGKSAYAGARDLAASDQVEWTPASLDARQSRMAQRAAHVWRSDFA